MKQRIIERKKCHVCGKHKKAEEFSNDMSRKDGKRNNCKMCAAKQYRKYYMENREKNHKACREYRARNRELILDQTAAYRAINYQKLFLSNIRHKAQKHDLDFDLDESDIIIPEVCPLLGIKIERNFKNNRDSHPSVDRKDPSKGYVKGNIKIISYRANRIKNNATPDEIKLLARRIDEYLKS